MIIKTTRLHESNTNQIFKTHFINHFKDNLEEAEKYHYEELVKYSNSKYLYFEERYDKDEYLKKLKETFLRINDDEVKYVINHDQFTRLCDAAINGNFQNTVNIITNEIYMLRDKLFSDKALKKQEENCITLSDKTNKKKGVFDNLTDSSKGKQKAFKLFTGLRKEGKDDQHKKDPQATVAYQSAVVNNLCGNTGVTNNATFSAASNFKTPEERIGELNNQLAMETDSNKILYIVSQIANLVPDKERFMKTLLSKLK